VKLDEVPRLGVAPCDPTKSPGSAGDVCQPDGTGHGPDSRAVGGDPGFVCKAFASGPPRCVKPCGRQTESGATVPDDTRCRPGHVCSAGPEGFLCVEAPAPRAECLTGDIRYAVQVGNGFRVTAGGLPSFVKAAEDASGACVPLPPGSPLLQDRLPLSAPLCANPPQTADENNLTVTLNRTTPTPTNPCFYEARNGDEPGQALHWKALFENPHLRFVVTNLENYVGDAALINFTVQDAFVPLRVLSTGGGSDVALGVRIVTGPMASIPVEGSGADVVPVPPYLFVIDQGKTLVELSRGQLLRLNPRFWSRGREGGRLDSQFTDSRFPIQ
jgi:hypothetical protein